LHKRKTDVKNREEGSEHWQKVSYVGGVRPKLRDKLGMTTDNGTFKVGWASCGPSKVQNR
jgi:hypothetical protein